METPKKLNKTDTIVMTEEQLSNQILSQIKERERRETPPVTDLRKSVNLFYKTDEEKLEDFKNNKPKFHPKTKLKTNALSHWLNLQDEKVRTLEKEVKRLKCQIASKDRQFSKLNSQLDSEKSKFKQTNLDFFVKLRKLTDSYCPEQDIGIEDYYDDCAEEIEDYDSEKSEPEEISDESESETELSDSATRSLSK